MNKTNKFQLTMANAKIIADITTLVEIDADTWEKAPKDERLQLLMDYADDEWELLDFEFSSDTITQAKWKKIE